MGTIGMGSNGFLLKKYFLVTLLIVLCPTFARNMPDVRAGALFKSQALLYIDGKKQLLKQGQISPEGIKLVAANSRSAIIEFRGQQYEIETSITSGGRFKEQVKQQAKIPRGFDGMYKTIGSINGQPVNFLVDTGASIVAMSTLLADHLGISYRDGRLKKVKTASGLSDAYFINLDSVQVGEIRIHHVEAAIIPASDSQITDAILLGMSFLSRVNMNDNGTVLQLEKKF